MEQTWVDGWMVGFASGWMMLEDGTFMATWWVLWIHVGYIDVANKLGENGHIVVKLYELMVLRSIGDASSTVPVSDAGLCWFVLANDDIG